jgi:predicted NUDIX family NTP pyrophosphohydrolase
MTASGTKLPIRDVRSSVANGGRPDTARTAQFGHRLQVLLVHPGGPFWRNKNKGAWSIPKGEMAEGEDAAAAARREFREEIGCDLSGPLEPVCTENLSSGVVVVKSAQDGA